MYLLAVAAGITFTCHFFENGYSADFLVYCSIFLMPNHYYVAVLPSLLTLPNPSLLVLAIEVQFFSLFKFVYSGRLASILSFWYNFPVLRALIATYDFS